MPPEAFYHAVSEIFFKLLKCCKSSRLEGSLPATGAHGESIWAAAQCGRRSGCCVVAASRGSPCPSYHVPHLKCVYMGKPVYESVRGRLCLNQQTADPPHCVYSGPFSNPLPCGEPGTTTDSASSPTGSPVAR